MKCSAIPTQAGQQDFTQGRQQVDSRGCRGVPSYRVRGVQACGLNSGYVNHPLIPILPIPPPIHPSDFQLSSLPFPCPRNVISDDPSSHPFPSPLKYGFANSLSPRGSLCNQLLESICYTLSLLSDNVFTVSEIVNTTMWKNFGIGNFCLTTLLRCRENYS